MGLSCCRLLKVTISPLPSCPKVPKPSPRPLWAHPSVQHLACAGRGSTVQPQPADTGVPTGLRRAPAPRHCRALTGSLEVSQSAPGQAGSSLRPAPSFSLQREARTHEHVLSQGRSFAWSACPGIRTLASSLKLIHSSSVISVVASPTALSKTVSPPPPHPFPCVSFCICLTYC